eukprot:CAMPEP_0206477888 /NCGR_PEP_ID=MMETSP0324_2-20121206/35706_1 /ASSEMBLY_ACC=CAM_ASM_000836 /TAXON_ID=2866 /ORGANISM="Crypthecodinium cohnii, Strain Seligo" /LENGTH=71 /DNA_ID=CAMNT_0053954049 /DNA_START=363 /DNA_END=578 /DNA_ORIENTATION=+
MRARRIHREVLAVDLCHDDRAIRTIYDHPLTLGRGILDPKKTRAPNSAQSWAPTLPLLLPLLVLRDVTSGR